MALAGVPAVLGQTVKANSNAKAQFSKYKTCSRKAVSAKVKGPVGHRRQKMD
jgi:hypothetical protein